MSIEKILIPPEDLEDLVNPTIPHAPTWFHEISHLLTYSPFIRKTPDATYLYVGNSGLKITLLPRAKNLDMSFSPNGNIGSERGEDKDEMRNIGIWAIAFRRFLESINLFFPEFNNVKGMTNDAMLSVRLRLLSSFSSRAMKVEEILDEENYQINIRECLLGFQSPTFHSSLFNKISARFQSLEEKLEIINPRLEKHKLDLQTGKWIYRTMD
jgi:hypothetical protein